MLKWCKYLWLALLFLVMVTPAFAGPYTRTIELESYETVKESIEVPFVLVDPNDPVNEELCDINLTGEYGCTAFETVNECETFKTTEGIKQNGNSGVFAAPEGTTSLTGEWRDKTWCWCHFKIDYCSSQWTPEPLYNLGGSDNWKFESGKHGEYRNFEAMVQTCSEETYCVEWTDNRVATVDYPANSVVTKTIFVNYSYDRVVTEINLGESITVRGHIWTNKLKPVEYWYVAQRATLPANAKTVAKSDKILVPDVNGVYATDSWTFTPDKPGIYRVLLRVLKVDGTMGSIRTKVIVNPAPPPVE